MMFRPLRIFDLARRLRREHTDAERLLWLHLRSRQLLGFKFRRQFPVGNHIVDFCCLERAILIEVDGGQHAAQLVQDEERTRDLERLGFRVLRFWNTDVLRNLDGVLERIAEILAH